MSNLPPPAKPVIVRCPNPKCRRDVITVTPTAPVRIKLVCPDPKCGREFIVVVTAPPGMGFKPEWKVAAGFTPKQVARNDRRAPGPDGSPTEDWAGLDELVLKDLDIYTEARLAFYYGCSAYYEEQAQRLRAYRNARFNVALSKVAARKDAEYAEELRIKEAAARSAADKKLGKVVDTVAGKERKLRQNAPPVNLEVLRSTLQMALTAFEASGLVPAAEAKVLRADCNTLAGVDRLAKRLGMPAVAQAR